MSRRVFKYPLSVFGQQEVILPRRSKVVHVAEQHGSVTLWVEVDLTPNRNPASSG